MVKLYIKIVFFLSILLVAACKEPYEHASVSQDNLLVVDGYLNIAGKATIRLTRTVRLADTARIKAESGALVTVESEDSLIKFLLTESQESGQKGYYSADLSLDKNLRYLLKIRTTNGKEYQSEILEVKETPAIDSLGWKRDQKGLQLYVNTHDPSNNTRYYRWNYTETWEVNSVYASYFEYLGREKGVVPREDPSSVMYCWGNNTLKELSLGTSNKLSEDVIFEKPLSFIPAASEKLSSRYSIIVSQYALTKEGYEYLLNMKKNSEQLGSVFDPQPSEIDGNIRCISNPEEKVIGFVGAGTVKEKRIFIRNRDVPQWGFRLSCEEILSPRNPDSLEYYFAAGYVPTVEVRGEGYQGVTPVCADCRTRGSNKRPDFWPAN